jgi:hypothetical protein
MASPKRTPPDTRTEYQRFLDMAREVEADESPGALDRAFDEVIRPASPKKPEHAERSTGQPKTP